jgi:hypothetical protein
MVRSILSTIALASLLMAATAALADPVRTQVSEQGAVSAPAPEHSASPAYNPDGEAAAKPASGKDASPIGFGWG